MVHGDRSVSVSEASKTVVMGQSGSWHWLPACQAAGAASLELELLPAQLAVPLACTGRAVAAWRQSFDKRHVSKLGGDVAASLPPGHGWCIMVNKSACTPARQLRVFACHPPLGRFSSVSPTQPKWNHSYGQSATVENGRCMVQLATETARRGLVNKPPSWSAQRPAPAAAAAAAAVHAPGFSQAIISPKEMRWQWQYLGSLGSAIASACCTRGQQGAQAEQSSATNSVFTRFMRLAVGA